MKVDRFSINNNKLLSLILKTIDYFTPFFFKKTKQINDLKIKNIDSKKPIKILISNIAHLGDVILSTSILKIIKADYPNSKIYFLCGSWSYDIIKDHQLIDKIITFDHFKLNRSSISSFKKLIKHFKSRIQAIKEIKNEKISIALDLRLHFPNSSYILYKGQIPIRIGYASGGFSKFFTNVLNYKQKNQHITKDYIDLLNVFLPNKINDSQLSPYIFLKDNEIIKNPLLIYNIPNNYYILHIGAGLNSKMLSLQKWKEITDILTSKKINIVFTGFGMIENEIIRTLVSNKSNCYNLCNKLSFNDFLCVVKNAKKVLCVDTSIIHIATSFDIPLIIFYSNVNNHHNWVLKKKNIKVVEFDHNNCDKMNLEKIDI